MSTIINPMPPAAMLSLRIPHLKPSLTPCHNFATTLYDIGEAAVDADDSSTTSRHSNCTQHAAPSPGPTTSPSIMPPFVAHAIDPSTAPEPIRVAPKPGKGRKRPNVFIDDRGFPDQSVGGDEGVG